MLYVVTLRKRHGSTSTKVEISTMINQLVTDGASCSRERPERRQNALRSLYLSFFMRRRTILRRNNDYSTNLYVDVHEPMVVALFSMTIFLSATDAMFTLFIISHGGEEINPFMRYLLGIDDAVFFWVKFFLTSFGMLFLVCHKHFLFYRVIRGYYIMYAVFVTYFILINYELYLINQIFSTS